MPITQNESFKAFVDIYAWGPLKGDEKRIGLSDKKKNAREAVATRTIYQIVSYVPIIGAIAAIAFAIFAKRGIVSWLRGEFGEEKRATMARLVITAIGLGPLFFLVDLIGTIVKASFNQFPKRCVVQTQRAMS